MPGRIVHRLITRYGELNDDLARNGLPTLDMPTAEEFNRRTGGAETAAHAIEAPEPKQPAAPKASAVSSSRINFAAQGDQLTLPIAAA
ncbi:hypothetical protein [Tsukamurella strandjordii]|uniref:hypothetical protein n=1 Tax=Tsukamurella strandjordii TaxID=147577 RepID=UPI0031D476BD